MMMSVAKWNSLKPTERKTIRGVQYLVHPGGRLEAVTISEVFKREKALAVFREKQYQDRLESSRK